LPLRTIEECFSLIPTLTHLKLTTSSSQASPVNVIDILSDFPSNQLLLNLIDLGITVYGVVRHSEYGQLAAMLSLRRTDRRLPAKLQSFRLSSYLSLSTRNLSRNAPENVIDIFRGLVADGMAIWLGPWRVRAARVTPEPSRLAA
jgi:hypothetical protein